MVLNAVLCDLTEFVGNPLRTGIQRVTFEAMAHWAGPVPLLPARVDEAGRLFLLPPQTLPLMREYFGTVPGDPERARRGLLDLAGEGPLAVEDVLAYRGILHTSLLPEWHRVAYYEGLLRAGGIDRVFFLVYDLLLWLHPEWFTPTLVASHHAYLRLLRRVRHLAFISGQTKKDFLTRVSRGGSPDGPIVPLGSDGLGLAEPCFTGSRRFAVIGTLEPRKNLMNVLDAFESLWAEGEEVELVFAGRMGWLRPADRERIDRLQQTQPLFRWRAGLGDAEVGELIRSCRATLYPSWAEGYGLPPLESLALGVPVVVSEAVPSTADLEPLGQLRLRTPNATGIRGAVRALLNDEFCQVLAGEIVKLRLPRWSDLGRGLAAWVTQRTQASRRGVAA